MRVIVMQRMWRQWECVVDLQRRDLEAAPNLNTNREGIVLVTTLVTPAKRNARRGLWKGSEMVIETSAVEGTSVWKTTAGIKKRMKIIEELNRHISALNVFPDLHFARLHHCDTICQSVSYDGHNHRCSFFYFH